VTKKYENGGKPGNFGHISSRNIIELPSWKHFLASLSEDDYIPKMDW
jgi:hypothetical protein